VDAPQKVDAPQNCIECSVTYLQVTGKRAGKSLRYLDTESCSHIFGPICTICSRVYLKKVVSRPKEFWLFVPISRVEIADGNHQFSGKSAPLVKAAIEFLS
jgi:hypothetical protein